jgi:hypothetical protein
MLFDFYALGEDYPGRRVPPGKSASQKAEHVEEAIGADVNNPRFIPYLQLHEYEALLFSNTDEIANQFYDPGTTPEPWSRLAASLRAVRSRFSSPEEINDNPQTCPSARLVQGIPSYRKTLHGPTVAQRIGMVTMKTECPHFRGWIERMEAI